MALATLLCSTLLLATAFGEPLNIVTKAQWNGREAAAAPTSLQHPLSRIVVCHTVGVDCATLEHCAAQLQVMQNYQMNTNHFDDIAYNFLIGNDGNVYEGRGWDGQGAFARGFNAGSLGIAFIGNYEKTTPTATALQAAQELLAEGVRLGKIAEDYKLHGHRQLTATNSPGNALYELVKQWPHWSYSIRV